MQQKIKVCTPHRYPWTDDGAKPPDPRYAPYIKSVPPALQSFIQDCGDLVDFHHSVCRHELFRVRNMFCEDFNQYSHILFCDADMAPKKEHLLQLLSHKVPVVSALMRNKTLRNQFCCGSMELVHAMGNDTVRTLFLPDGEETLLQSLKPSLQQREFTGAGFLLIQSSIFSTEKISEPGKIPKPWFRHEYIDQDQTSEDIGFCFNCRDNDIPVMVDFDCEVEHLADAEEVL